MEDFFIIVNYVLSSCFQVLVTIWTYRLIFFLTIYPVLSHHPIVPPFATKSIHLGAGYPLLFFPSTFPSTRTFSRELDIHFNGIWRMKIWAWSSVGQVRILCWLLQWPISLFISLSMVFSEITSNIQVHRHQCSSYHSLKSNFGFQKVSRGVS